VTGIVPNGPNWYPETGEKVIFFNFFGLLPKLIEKSFAQYLTTPTFASPLEKLGFAICLSESE
jgi:hypothetical protein